jgi:hypothetical protein
MGQMFRSAGLASSGLQYIAIIVAIAITIFHL